MTFPRCSPCQTRLGSRGCRERQGIACSSRGPGEAAPRLQARKREWKSPLYLFMGGKGELFSSCPRALKAGEGEGWGYCKAARRVSAGVKQRWGCGVAGATRSLPPVGAANYTPRDPRQRAGWAIKREKASVSFLQARENPEHPPKMPPGRKPAAASGARVMPPRWGHPMERGHPMDMGWGRAPGGASGVPTPSTISLFWGFPCSLQQRCPTMARCPLAAPRPGLLPGCQGALGEIRGAAQHPKSLKWPPAPSHSGKGSGKKGYLQSAAFFSPDLAKEEAATGRAGGRASLSPGNAVNEHFPSPPLAGGWGGREEGEAGLLGRPASSH